MASVYWHCCYISPCFNKNGVIANTKRKQPVLSYKYYSHRPQHEQNNKPFHEEALEEDGHGHATRSTRRRQIVLQAPLISISLPQLFMSDSNVLALPGNDVPQNFREYTDDVNKFRIFIPQDWQVGAGEPNGFKSITAFYPEEAANSNVTVVITGLGPDFTRMESFGKVEAFADTLVSGLDRSWQRPPGVAAKLIDCKAGNGFYYIEYTLQNPGESRKHLFSAIGMASNGWYNRLYTVTGQFVEEEAEKYGSRIEKAVSSFKFI
ncbi:psbP domain-containing protein 3, chloroplastic isoform X1 [Durio zibethinus]|uniref:PsbP domain-containing protein 3, chloroplastic isoform X1 n=1 Tax=Durio zibethinus TaxID=66656 RepID=A0A6P6B5U1_DURZI|nr:psbP domain-containing protein 3, chloroplastic isoform X1 [Durio zibethinus]